MRIFMTFVFNGVSITCAEVRELDLSRSVAFIERYTSCGADHIQTRVSITVEALQDVALHLKGMKASPLQLAKGAKTNKQWDIADKVPNRTIKVNGKPFTFCLRDYA